MRIATFNVQNLRLRHRGGRPVLDGARDRDMAGPDDPALDRRDRRLTAKVLARIGADVVALQEVFDAATLDHFHDSYLRPAGAPAYPHRVCLPGNDGHGFNVALLSRAAPSRVESHAAATPRDLGLDAAPDMADRPVFRRDCLEAEIGRLTLFVCHFKAPYPDPSAAWDIRRLEAQAVAVLIRARFADPAAALWLVIGDLNEPPRQPEGRGSALAPLTGLGADLFARLDARQAWTFSVPGSPAGGGPGSESGRHTRPDAMIAAPALAALCPDARPAIVRAGMDSNAAPGARDRLAGVGATRPHASDHAAIHADFAGL